MKRKNIQLYRNLNILPNREDALNKINEILNMEYVNDGTPYVCRYYDNDIIETILVIASVVENKKQFSLFDSKEIKTLQNKIDVLTKKIEILENK